MTFKKILSTSSQTALKEPLDYVMLHSGICSYDFANRSFCWSDISRVQLKSNWTVGKWLLASDSKTVWKSRLILIKIIKFFNGCFGNSSISKKLALKEPLDVVMLHSGYAQTLTWSCEPIILLIGHFEGPTEVQLNSWWKSASLWSRRSQRMEAKFT